MFPALNTVSLLLPCPVCRNWKSEDFEYSILQTASASRKAGLVAMWRADSGVHSGVTVVPQASTDPRKSESVQTYSTFEGIFSSGAVSSSDWSLSRSQVWMDDVSATSRTGAMLGLLTSLTPSTGRARVGPLAGRQLVSCKSIATVPGATRQESRQGACATVMCPPVHMK